MRMRNIRCWLSTPCRTSKMKNSVKLTPIQKQLSVTIVLHNSTRMSYYKISSKDLEKQTLINLNERSHGSCQPSRLKIRGREKRSFSKSTRLTQRIKRKTRKESRCFIFQSSSQKPPEPSPIQPAKLKSILRSISRSRTALSFFDKNKIY